MKKFLLAGSALAILSISAIAADLPSRTLKPIAPISAAPMFTWTGLYAGVNAGYAWSGGTGIRHRGDASTFTAITAGQLPFGFDSKRSGFIGGGQIGYNYQFGQFVLGYETDIQYLGAKQTNAFAGTGGVLSSFTSEQNYLGTLRGRLGFTPMDRLLVYGTGGLAYGDSKVSAQISTPATGAVRGGSRSETNIGWTLGAGAEYAFTNNWTAKAEYLYYDLGKSKAYHAALNAAAVTANPGVGVLRSDNAGHITRLGLNYKF